MEGGGNGAAGLMMGFRDHNSSSSSSNGAGLSSMMMMMPLNMASAPLPNHVGEMNNTLFLPLSNSNTTTTTTNNNHNHITHFSSNSDHQVFKENNNNNSKSAAAGCYFMKMNNNNNNDNNNNNNNNNSNNNNNNNSNNNNNNNEGMMISNSTTSSSCSSFRAKIMSHPHYPRLLTAYVNCQKVGAPPEVVKRLEEVCASSSEGRRTSCIGEDPGLDQFMEAYCEMLIKYEQELTKPFKEAMLFISSIESQLKSLTVASSSDSGGNGSPEEEIDASEDNYIDPHAEDREIKVQLLRKYSGYLGSLKQEFLKKRKKGKLPKEARQQLLDWWSRHYKWPYPSEAQKLALSESTGLDQKQINNWFINQRKRHWKPSEEMQFVVMDPAHPNQYYIENIMTSNPFSLDYCTQPSLF